MPGGTYRNVCVGSVRVYAVVTYDPVEGYFIDTFSILDETIRGMRLYTPSLDCDINISASEGLNYDIPTKDFESLYYVSYDANGGIGTMPTTLMDASEVQVLPKNQFTKPGYTFAGWSLEPNGEIIYLDEAVIENVKFDGKVVTMQLYAVWELRTIIVNAETFTVTLSWGETPRNLDAHLEFGSTHISHHDMSSDSAFLDGDDKDGHGCEVIRVTSIKSDTVYTYYVEYRRAFGEIIPLPLSSAMVTLYIGGSVYKYSPQIYATMSSRWEVFTYDSATGVLTVSNEVQ